MHFSQVIFVMCVFLQTVLCQSKVVNYINGDYNKKYTFSVDNNLEYIISFPPTLKKNPFRVISSSHTSSIEFPAIVVVRQEKEVISWQIPMIMKNNNGFLTFTNISHTLCYNPSESMKLHYRSMYTRSFSISISTSSGNPIDVTIDTNEVVDFKIKDGINYTTTISPSEPSFFYYSFEGKSKESTAFISVDSPNEVCLTFSIQNSICPVRDLNKEIRYEGKYQTMTTKGALTVPASEFPTGFFIVFVTKPDDYDCTDESAILQYTKIAPPKKLTNRVSTVHFKIQQGSKLREYRKAVLIIFGAFCGFCILVLLIVYFSYRFGNLRKLSKEVIEEDEIDFPPKCDELYFKREKIKLLDFVHHEKLNEKKSFNYLWHIMNIGLFYGIPVVQLMGSYQRAVRLSGDQDICYHNLYCAHPLEGLSDFNHVYSNIGYIMVGLLFLGITAFRQKVIKLSIKYGISYHYGMFYAMGIALIIEGILSACYHICPNQSNFQFDTSFMYVMAVLVTVKLYQNRHPDINASAYATFSVLGCAVLIAMFGILSGAKAVIVIFILCYITLCTYLSFKVYFFGDVLNGLKDYYQEFQNNKSILERVKPIRVGHFVILLVANICNYAMAGVGVYLYPNKTNFGTYLLAILMGNAILHTIFYIIMKLYRKERMCLEAITYGLIALGLWGVSCYFFFNGPTQWQVTPAESKQLNNECLILGFYDQHDIWHMLSATALLFSFMLLLCIDDDLASKSKEEIYVF